MGSVRLQGGVLGMAVLLLLCGAVRAGAGIPPEELDVSNLKTYSVQGKELDVLEVGKETEILHRAGKGCLTHMWFAMDDRVRVRVYVDNEKQPSIDMALDLGHGYAFGGSRAPWGNPRFGKYGGQFNNYQIPYGDGIRVTLLPTAKVLDGPLGRKAWWIVRGTENLPLRVGGRRLPAGARLKLYRLEDYRAKPLEEFALCDVKGSGQLYLVTMAVKADRQPAVDNDLAYMEGCMRAYLDGEAEPNYLASGLEDYFLGAGYFFQNQKYYGAVAGLTYLDKKAGAFSAYRFHDEDPVFFQKGLRLTCRCCEAIAGKVYHDAPPARYSAYVWLYQW